jgi:hypothetical protein
MCDVKTLSGHFVPELGDRKTGIVYNKIMINKIREEVAYAINGSIA